MAAAAIFDNFEWAYLRNGYLYSTHRAVIFAIAQLSCKQYRRAEKMMDITAPDRAIVR